MFSGASSAGSTSTFTADQRESEPQQEVDSGELRPDTFQPTPDSLGQSSGSYDGRHFIHSMPFETSSCMYI